MSHCYNCGRPIPFDKVHLRRRVRTGDQARNNTRSTKASSGHATFGMRIVCRRCAIRIDKQKTTGELLKHLSAVGLLFAMIAVLFLLR